MDEEKRIRINMMQSKRRVKATQEYEDAKGTFQDLESLYDFLLRDINLPKQVSLAKENPSVCCICGKTLLRGEGRDPWPVVKEEGSLACCDGCFKSIVLKIRVKKAQIIGGH